MIECFFAGAVVSCGEWWQPHAGGDNRRSHCHPPHPEGPGPPQPLPLLPEGPHCCRGWRAHQEGGRHHTWWRYKASLSQIWHVEDQVVTRLRVWLLWLHVLQRLLPTSACLLGKTQSILAGWLRRDTGMLASRCTTSRKMVQYTKTSLPSIF